MEIEIKNEEKEYTFKDLRIGDTFSDCEDVGPGDIYMYVENEYGLGSSVNNCDDDGDFDGYAVNLGSGFLYGFHRTDVIYKLRVKCTASKC